MWTIRHGKSELLLPELEPDSIDSCVTDPPYFLSFMGKGWDGDDSVARTPELWRLVLRVLKPGAHLLAFGGSRTFHRLTVAIEDAGFEVRDVLCWLYGQGMPKSHDVSKAIDKAAGAEREVLSTYQVPDMTGDNYGQGKRAYEQREHHVTAPATPEAEQWDGWGTALSPSWEPIVLARKPLASTVAANVLEHGTGGLNIDGCRLEGGKRVPGGLSKRNLADLDCGWGFKAKADVPERDPSIGRWPPNVALDEEAAAAVDRQGEARGVHGAGRVCGSKFARGPNLNTYGTANLGAPTGARRGDTGGASRFFYVAKASTSERNAGLGDEQNPHPTVKPIALMRWLCRLVTPPGGLVLDPFCGSGSTGVAAVLEGCRFLGLEQDAEAVRVAKLRLHHHQPDDEQVATVEPAQAKQGSLF